MTDKLTPVRCGCGGEAQIDWVLQPDGVYMTGVYCENCGTKTIPFWSMEKDKAIDYAVTTWNLAMGERKIIHCIDCVYWMDNCVYLNDGRIRKYADGEKFVGADVGINEGSKCLYDEDHGVHLGGYAIFRQANDFCSKAEKRRTDYDAWFGIKDGIYARRWKEDE